MANWVSLARIVALLCVFLCGHVVEGQYDPGYNEYADYAAQAAKGKKRRGGGGSNWLILIGSGVGGHYVGGWLKGRSMARKHAKEKKELLQYIQQIDEVYRKRETQWQTEYQKLYKAYEGLEKDSLERDYEEFKAPDTDGDDKVSREEFAIYVRKYLSSFPELSEKDFPKFEEFDLDGDGIVSFAEWQRFLQQQKLIEASKDKKSTDDGAYGELLKQLYAQTHEEGTWPQEKPKGGRQTQGRR